MSGFSERMRRWFSSGNVPPEPAAPRESRNMRFGNAHALVVGVGADLPGTVDDATALRDILVDPDRCGYKWDNVCLLTSQAATRDAILQAMDALAGTADADSSVVVYFSGHGSRSMVAGGECYHLMPYGYDVAALDDTCIGGDEFTRRLALIRSKKLLLLLDCCHAGGFSLQKTPWLQKSPLPAPEQILSRGAGRVVIASSRADELSLAGSPYSVFTLALLEALSGSGASTKDGLVYASDLALYTHAMVKKRTSDRQSPILNFSEADNFAVAWYAGGATEPKAPPVPETARIEDGTGGMSPVQPGIFVQPGWTVGNVINISGSTTANLGKSSDKSKDD